MEESESEFVEGDVVKVKPEWLSDGEKEDPKYAEAEYYVKDCWNGAVEVVCPWDGFTGFLISTWRADTVYKVGHVNPSEVKSAIGSIDPDRLAKALGCEK